MQFDALLGNAVLKQRLSSSIAKGQSSHCYLITGAKGSGKRTLAKLLAAALQCTQSEKPCLQCPQCRKVLSGTHPDVLLVDEEEKKTLSVKTVRNACTDLYIRPNEGKKKIYIFPRAQMMRDEGQNALLKCIEEPPAYGVFLLLTEHAEQLLPTIRSRCAQLRLAPLPDDILRAQLLSRVPNAEAEAVSAAILRSGGYLGQALELLEENTQLFPETIAFQKAYAEADALGLLRVLCPMERFTRDRLRPILLQWQELLASALSARSGLPAVYAGATQIARARSTASLLQALNAIKESIAMLDGNVGAAHICGGLSILLR